jgi:hypothetical protein
MSTFGGSMSFAFKASFERRQIKAAILAIKRLPMSRFNTA